MATSCPGCGQDMAPTQLDAVYGRTVNVDVCPACGAFWFDRNESTVLTPGAVLKLFVVIGEQQGDRRPLSTSMACPRCRGELKLTFDMQRTTRFGYWRCPAEHGRFTTFAEFLREKNFVRSLSPAELAQLRASVKTVQCGSCGAPIDLEHSSVCAYCRAPVSVLDPRQMETVVAQLRQAEAAPHTVDPMVAESLAADRLHVERLFRTLDRPDGGKAPNLIEAGLAALGDLLSSR